MFGVIDCNNFFVSCERVFCPRLIGKPVVVLSNNDGCVVARSNEAKAMGIEMGVPYFKIQALVETGKLQVRSGNLTLYGDMSKRVMSIVRKRVPLIEIYSIDECFMDLSGIEHVEDFGRHLSALVERWTGIPVSVGIAPSKTLAKMASRFAKKYRGYQGCCVIDSEDKRIKALKLTAANNVWGIGRKMNAVLSECHVKTAYDFSLWSKEQVCRFFSLPALHTWKELNGHSCISLEPASPKKSIISSRSFKQSISDFESLHALIAEFCALCAGKLRREHSACQTITIFIRTDRFRTDLPQYANTGSLNFEVATSDIRELAAAAHRILQRIYRPHFAYKKAGVMLSNIVTGPVQGNLFDKVNRKKQVNLLEAIDSIHEKMGQGMLKVASQEPVSNVVRHQFQSRNFTTDLNSIIEVR